MTLHAFLLMFRRHVKLNVILYLAHFNKYTKKIYFGFTQSFLSAHKIRPVACTIKVLRSQ